MTCIYSRVRYNYAKNCRSAIAIKQTKVQAESHPNNTDSSNNRIDNWSSVFFWFFGQNFVSNQNFTNLNENPLSEGDKLTPTNDIEGTWKSTFPSEFTIVTDYKNFGLFADIGTEDRMMIWTITGTSDKHVVLVNFQFNHSNRELIPGSGYTPDALPMQIRGIINAIQLTLIN